MVLNLLIVPGKNGTKTIQIRAMERVAHTKS